MKLIKFIRTNTYSLVIVISCLIFMGCLCLCDGEINTPFGLLSYFVSNDEYDCDIYLDNQENMDEISDDYGDFELDSNADDSGMSDMANINDSINSSELIESDDSKDLDDSDDSVKINGLDKTNASTDLDISADVDNIDNSYNAINIHDNVTDAVWASTLNEEGDYSWLQEFDKGITPVSFYTPDVNATRYYRDLGIVAGNTNADYKVEGASYFDNVCWIGDSRMLGVYDYSGFPGDYYCDNGYCFYDYHIGKAVTYQNEHRKIDITEIMQEKQYDKIYVMMGINDCGYMTTTDIRSYMKDFVDMLLSSQKDAVIFLVANMHVSEKIEQSKEIYSNKNVNAKNVALASLADGQSVFYIDFNEFFIDENGYLINSKTFDGFHLYAREYEPIINFFIRHGISK